MEGDDPMLSTNLEIVELSNGRFSVLPMGSPSSLDDEGEFDSREEAEAWMFQREQDLEARASDPNVMLPGGGQGVR